MTEAGRTWLVRPHRHLCGAVRHCQMGWTRGLSASRLHVSCYLMRIVEAMGLGRTVKLRIFRRTWTKVCFRCIDHPQGLDISEAGCGGGAGGGRTTPAWLTWGKGCVQ